MPEQLNLLPNRGEEIHAWITAHLAAGRTVYVSTYTRCWKITKPSQVRYHAGHCEIQRGRHWDSINGCNLRATY